ncbi:dTMP kinase [Nocardia nova]|uniref:dTMP kinase n=1 Tax=Nocardia nova TaxID=37330 RepID=UPI0033D8ED87
MSPPVRNAAGSPLWVSIEGRSGVGKTTAARAVASAFGRRCLLVDELTDQPGDTLPGLVIAALHATGGDSVFLRTGHPVAETLAFLALQVHKAERLVGRDLTGVEVIVEDRGVDTVAACQASILCSHYPQVRLEPVVQRVLSSLRRWSVFPDATILLTGDPAVCTERFGERIGHPLAARDVALLDQIDDLYRAAAAADPGRFTALDVGGLSPSDSAAAVGEVVSMLLDRRVAHAS